VRTSLSFWQLSTFPSAMLGVRTARQSGLVSVLPVDSLGSEVHAGGSVDLQSARDAPAGEFCRIEINTLGDRALALELSFRPLGTMEPLVVGGRELRRIDEDDEEESASNPLAGTRVCPRLGQCALPWASLVRAEPAVGRLSRAERRSATSCGRAGHPCCSRSSPIS
jgi:hypothetical protein